MQLLNCLVAAAVLLDSVSAAPAPVPSSSSSYASTPELPVIDLGYVKQQATEYNETARVFVYRNVRFAAPPLADLRLRKPQPPLTQEGIQNGNFNRSTACPQWNGTSLFGDEDCLFLDIYVPEACIYNRRVPVLAWWYGGGYVNGAKEEYGAPWGLFDQATEPFIFVASNYRLGALGFMAPPDEDVDTNIGLHDTHAAIDWIGKYICKFGGNTEKITVMGQSAGAGVLTHAIVSYGGEGKTLPFQQAILQSPGWTPEANIAGRIPIWEAFKNNTGCANATCIRELPTLSVQLANVLTQSQWQSGVLGATSGFYPVVDGDYIPDFPINLLAEDKFHKEVKSIISSSTRWEGRLYIPENITTAVIPMLIATQLTPNPAIVEKLLAEYPDDGNAYRRAVEIVGDIAFNCNGYWLSRAFSAEEEPGHHSRRYMFNLGTAIHGSDLNYTFNAGGWSYAPSQNLAMGHQRLIADYTVNGDCALKNWPEWSEEEAEAMWLNGTGLAVGEDYYKWAVNVDRCDFLRDEVIGKG